MSSADTNKASGMDKLRRLSTLLEEAASLLSMLAQDGKFDESMLFEMNGELMDHNDVLLRIQGQVNEIAEGAEGAEGGTA